MKTEYPRGIKKIPCNQEDDTAVAVKLVIAPKDLHRPNPQFCCSPASERRRKKTRGKEEAGKSEE